MADRASISQTEAAVRSLPWSTRAVILVAFAIQFGSVGAGIAASVTPSTASLRLCDGGLLPMLWADAALGGAVAEGAGPLAVGRAGDVAALSPACSQVGSRLISRVVCPAQLPIPPPAAA
ncbi:MAG: hypothetical protein HND58_09560 [Planctomycetota bacterium]|nr:MAG: hypothetical protein HND58_09560 [Planctomycetota bacterium]